jgi:hypothetical protein
MWTRPFDRLCEATWGRAIVGRIVPNGVQMKSYPFDVVRSHIPTMD